MFDHVTIRVIDRIASERFYDTALTPLGIDRTYRTRWFSEWQDFMLTGADDADPQTRGLHIAFVAPSPEQVDAFWQAGTEAGYTDEGRPVLRDPNGNRVEAVHHGALRRGGIIDHLRIGVADVAAATGFYETIAPHAGLRLSDQTPDRVQFTGVTGSFSLLSATPTEHLHMAFPTDDDADVQRFHQAATDAGYRSNGPPGERPRYHRGYYAAYVLDPDGNNIEVVNHHRT
jgi:catechol 2,3-dioxygenase-like lactoylglutathione lyase family enzyme